MSEIRYEPLTGTWVVIATERKKRPSDFVIAHEEKTGAFCPFCPGNEDHTPPEVYAVRPEGKPNTPGWLTRVVPNKFPALSPDNQDKKQAPTGGDLLAKSPGLGAHEVILESPDHETTFPFLTPEQQALVVATWHQRYTELQQNPDFKFAQLFKNHGAEAGASLEHPHSQLIATPVVPRAVETEIRRSADYHLRQGNCLICSLIEKELQEGARILTQNRSFVVFCP
ncbi:MAG: galactose-1-phosphate uridylyltransferase, partial [Clostridia bacterium]|nr:galactose-1-phosphate uridylyltransferase [Clostridia bacterium]